jgi:hypothetical protein
MIVYQITSERKGPLSGVLAHYDQRPIWLSAIKAGLLVSYRLGRTPRGRVSVKSRNSRINSTLGRFCMPQETF